MRVRTWSACVALAWAILLIFTAAAGPIGSPRPAQATTRTASTTSTTGSTSTTTTTTTSPGHPDRQRDQHAGEHAGQGPRRPAAAGGRRAARGAARRPRPPRRAGAAGYVVQPGDTLSGIAAALGVRGGWPALYAANRRAIGPDPALIRPGTILALPGRAAPARYAITAGDTLSGIAAALAVPGGWPALYNANRRVIGPDPNVIRAGTILAIPRPASPSPAPRPSPPAPTSPAPRPAPTPASTPATALRRQRPQQPRHRPQRRRRPAASGAPGRSPRFPREACPGGWRSCSSRPGCSSRPRS